MRRRLVLLALLLLSSGAALAQPVEPRIEVLFVLDSTGSMSSAIHEAKTRVLEIAASIASGEPRPRVRFGVLTYRDRGDAYVTKRWPLSDDWEATRAGLASITADGGGDTPESVVQALHEGIRDTAWTFDQSVMKLVYLIGDAPPKHYDDDPDLDADLRWAAENGIVVHSIGCAGLRGSGQAFFARAARLAEGRYHALEGAGTGALLPGSGVATVEEAERRSAPRSASMSDIVARTARSVSGELGVHYEEAGLAPITADTIPVAEGEGSGLRGAHGRLVGDAASWRLLWAAHSSTLSSPAPLPAVDFHEHSLIVLSDDAGVGTVEILRSDELLVVRRQPVRRGVLARLFSAAPEAGARVAIYRIPAWSGPVRFETEGGRG